ncbi:MAG: site-specific integrase [Planctomycetota bacterium]|nr:site-specific integrase [Planctomycetota bacterium]
MAIVKVHGQRVYLGAYDSPESRAKYARFLKELKASGGHIPQAPADFTVAELCARFWQHATQHYVRPDGTQTDEIANLKSVIAVLLNLYQSEPVASFGPLALKACRESMIEKGWTRGTINSNVGRLRRVFRWGVGEQLVPPAVHQALCAVDGLTCRVARAPETKKIVPATSEQITAVVARVGRIVATMIEVQRLTGARPGEVCIMRAMDIDRSGEVWVYHPSDHKNAWRGADYERQIYIGPRAQAHLAPFLLRDASAFLFSPIEAQRERFAARKTHRTKPNKKPATARKIREHYDVDGYRRCIERACKAAGIKPWVPNMLRHTRATELRKMYGLEAACVVLGHEDIETTKIYAEKDRALAMKAMQEVG